jgi:heavy metal translocating P-type ATPase
LAESVTRNSLSPHKSSDQERDSGRTHCALCGLLVGRSRAETVVDGETLRFCCQGCLQVFQILFNSSDRPLSNFRETDLYRACLEAGVIPRDEADLASRQSLWEVEDRGTIFVQTERERDHAQELTLRVEGMWCSACAWVIDEVLKKTRGILETKVLFLSDMAQVKYLPQLVSPRDIQAKISRLGYGASPFQESPEISKEKKDLLLRLGISAFLTANIMMISFALYMGFFEDLSRQTIQYLSFPLGVLATPVILYGGFPILKRAFMGLRHGGFSMDTLISAGALAAYGYSILQMLKGTLHVYFDTASMLITLVLLGRYIETQAKDKISRGITELYRLANQKVRLLIDGRERWITPDGVEPGAEFLVLAGERIPLDGRVAANGGYVDESVLTGETKPLRKGVNDEIMGGTLLLEGQMRVRATRGRNEGSLRQMIRLMEEALSKKNPFELLADRIMRWFVPSVLCIGVGTAAYLKLAGLPIDEALLRGVTVLVITCPCAFGIASPLAKVAAIGVSRSRGILVRDPAALEKVKALDTIVFDKTGTMTQGNFSLRFVVSQAVTEEVALRRIASVESHSDHFLAREVMRKAGEVALSILPSTDFEVFEGLGVKGRTEDMEVMVGNRRLMGSMKQNLPTDLEQKGREFESNGMTVVFFSWDGQVQGLLSFGDSLKRDASKTVAELTRRGIRVWLVSGDSEETTRAVAGELDVDNFLGRALPQDKVCVIKTLQMEGHAVGMIGDGFNDAAALAQADVGFALGSGANLTQEASDMTLLTEDPSRIIEMFDLSAMTVKTIRQNLFFAFSYNAIGIPLAVAGFLNPLIAVFAMFASSLTVIGNSWRIMGRRKRGWESSKITSIHSHTDT